jgi:catechol-2,3-dioxygenase
MRPLVVPSAVAGFSSGRTHHELMLIGAGPEAQPIPQGRRVDMCQFALKVGDSDDDLRAVHDGVIAAGATIVGATDHVVTHSPYLRDPDGNDVELYVDVPGMDWKNDPSVMLARGGRCRSDSSEGTTTQRHPVTGIPCVEVLQHLGPASRSPEVPHRTEGPVVTVGSRC